MRRFIKPLSALLMIILISFSYAGCDEDKEKLQKTDTADFLKTTSANTTVTFLYPTGPASNNYEKVFEEVSMRAKKQLGINVLIKESSSPIFTDYNASEYPFKTNAQFDAAILFADYCDFVNKDYLMDITELLPEYAPQFYARLDKEALRQVTYNNAIYAIPPLIKGSQRLCVVMREDLASKYDIKDINTLNDYEAAIDKIRSGESADLVSVMDYSKVYLLPQVYGYGVVRGYFVYKLDDPKMKLMPFEKAPEFGDIYFTFKRLSKKGFILNNGRLGTLKAHAGSKRLLSFMTSWDEAHQFTRSLNAINEHKYKVFPMYKEKPAPRTDLSNEPVIVINKKAAHPDLAIKVVEWIHQNPEIHDLLVYGIENQDYTMENGRVKLTEGKNHYYGWYGSRAFMDDYYLREMTADPQGYRDEFEQEVEFNTEYLPSSGFSPIYDNYDESKILTRDVYIGILFDFEYDTVDDIIEMTERGYKMSELCAKVQTQLDAWKREKGN